MAREHAQFISTWQQETQATVKLLRALPEGQYDFRPDAGGRSLGELAWHLAETEAFISDGVANNNWDFSRKLPGLERPRTIDELAPAFERVHAEALVRVAELQPARLDDTTPFMGRDMRVGDVLWFVLLHHLIHHRGQLTLMCRIAGGTPPGLYGPTREEMAAMKRG